MSFKKIVYIKKVKICLCPRHGGI